MFPYSGACSEALYSLIPCVDNRDIEMVTALYDYKYVKVSSIAQRAVFAEKYLQYACMQTSCQLQFSQYQMQS